MAGSNSILQLAVLAKQETVIGTEETLVAADGLANFSVLDLSLEPQRIDKKNLARRKFGHGKDMATFDAEGSTVKMSITTPAFEVAAAGDKSSVGHFLQACGLKETVTAGVKVVYTPETPADVDDVKTVTIHAYKAGIKHKAIGARGTFSLSASPADGLDFKFEMTCPWSEPVADQALPADPPAAGTKLSFTTATVITADGQEFCIGKFEFDLGAVVEATVLSCGIKTNIVDFKPTIKIDPYANPEVSKWAQMMDPTATVALVASFNSGALVFTAPKMRLAETGTEERAGKVVDTDTYELLDTNGDDSFSIEVK